MGEEDLDNLHAQIEATKDLYGDICTWVSLRVPPCMCESVCHCSTVCCCVCCKSPPPPTHPALILMPRVFVTPPRLLPRCEVC